MKVTENLHLNSGINIYSKSNCAHNMMFLLLLFQLRIKDLTSELAISNSKNFSNYNDYKERVHIKMKFSEIIILFLP